MQLKIDEALAHRLIATQFPQWRNLSIRSVTVSGWDNKTFHLGNDMLIRMPSAEHYAAQVEKEQKWLPKLAPFLPLAIPIPLAKGKPSEEYPWSWSIYRWLEGETAASAKTNNLSDIASDLAKFIVAFHHINATEGPLAGSHSFHRGGSLSIYDNETRHAIGTLKENAQTAIAIWEEALATTWSNPPLWVHGDVSPGNLLVHNGKLSAVIDFGQLAVGDPACDLAIAWTFFKGESREIFRTMLPFDAGTWARGRGWALWKTLCAPLPGTERAEVERIIGEILADHKK